MIATVIGCVLAAVASAALICLVIACRPVSGRHAAPRRAALLVWQDTPAVPAPRRPVNGRYLGTQPRRTPYPSAADPMVPVETDDDPPWDVTTAQQPALDEDAPTFGEAPIAMVLEAERLAEVMTP